MKTLHKYTSTLFRLLVVVCITGASAFAVCPPEVPAIAKGAIAPNGPYIAAQCPEACPDFSPGQYQTWGQNYDFLDWITVRCNNGSIQPIYSTTNAGSSASTCWNCVGGCAGQNCPPGELCVPIPRTTGYDCQRFACPAGYTIAERSSTGEPYCVLTNPETCDDDDDDYEPITLTLDGPSTIRTGTTCSWFADAIGGSPTANKTYTWYVSNNPVGTGQYYSGGRPSGTLVGYSWRLRVDVTDGLTYASKEILVKESASAPICAN